MTWNIASSCAGTNRRIRHVACDYYASERHKKQTRLRFRRSCGETFMQCAHEVASGHGDEGGHGFDAVPEVLQAEVFVGGVLVVVVVGDGDADGWGVCGSLHGVERDGSAGGWQKDDFAAGGFDCFDDVGGDGEIHGGAGGCPALVGLVEGGLW